MKSCLRIFSVLFLMGSVAAKGAHHHHTSHHHRYPRGYSTAVLSSAPLVSKSIVPAVSVPVSYAHAPLAYTHAHAAPVAYTGYHAHAAAPLAYTGYQAAAPLSYGVYGAHTHGIDNSHLALLSTAGKPKTYSQSIPAAAIRNVETVMVTKTITPVVTKTTTHHTRAEPALSVGHVQGYSHGAVGVAKIAPVQFNTQYTTYANPTVGVNGPVAYSGPAVGYGVGAVAGTAEVVAQPVVKAAALGAVAPATYTVVPGSALSLASYGYDAHSIPATNFLDLSSGKAVLTNGYHAYGH